ncbi:hypothetical protein LTS18_007530 [Coniosporium uncinatum]|uniref:Uncharacterized protein n=1 Tax=Coniosporium uncinatum TaxID=93489 RepID=A0ACC3DXS4_9PEZI|nr:hypothetical protein LTS18_007530 [Coniosporium uncinatum]
MADEARRSGRQRTASQRLHSQTDVTPDCGRKAKRTARPKQKESAGSPAPRPRPKKKGKTAVPVIVETEPELSPTPPTQALNEDQIVGEEDEVAAEQEEELPFTFELRYSAVAGKEELPASIRTRRATWPGSSGYSMFDLEEWKLEARLRQRPRKYKTLNIRLTASFEGCKEADKVRSDAYEDGDLDDVMEVMRAWSKRWPTKQLVLTVLMKCEEEKDEVVEVPPSAQSQSQAPRSQARTDRADKKRLTETQRQESAIAFMTQAEVSGNGGFYERFNERWICKSDHRKNKGYTCWRAVRPGQADSALLHYKVQGPLLVKWMREVQAGDCELETPWPDLVVAFIKAKEKAEKRDVELYGNTDPSASSDHKQFQQLLMGQVMINLSSQLGSSP